MQHDEKLIKDLRKRFPKGTRVELISMIDPYSRLKSGDRGTVKFIDDMGTIFVNWDCGSGLGLIYGEDRFSVVAEYGL